MSSKSKARKDLQQRINTETSSQLAKRYHEIGIKAVAAALQNQDSAQQREEKDQAQKTNHDKARENADE
jgi:hypothetical protein